MLKLAGCVIQDKASRILLLHRNTDLWQHWEIPGGKVEENEDPKATAIRELKEEAGVTVKIVRLLGQKEFLEKGKALSYSWFLAEIIEGEPSITEPEIFDDIKYFSIPEMHKLTLSEGAKTLLHLLDDETITLVQL